MNAFLSTTSLALFAIIITAAGTGCAAEEAAPVENEETSDVALGDTEDAPIVLPGEMKTMISVKNASGTGTAPDACPEGKEPFYNLCYNPCPAAFPIPHITMCFKVCNGYDEMVSPGNCLTRAGYVSTPSGGYYMTSNYASPSVDRGVGTDKVCAANQVSMNGRCYTNGAAKPVTTAKPASAPVAQQPMSPLDRASDECNHKRGYMWHQATGKCLTVDEFLRLPQPSKQNPELEERPCFGLSCLDEPGKVDLGDPNPGPIFVPKLGCMDSDDPFCFLR
jgi:hypothetical protein